MSEREPSLLFEYGAFEDCVKPCNDGDNINTCLVVL